LVQIRNWPATGKETVTGQSAMLPSFEPPYTDAA